MTQPAADPKERPDLIFELEIIDSQGARQRVRIGAVSPADPPTTAVTLTMGRQAGNDLVLDDQKISRQHMLIACSPGGCRVVDLDSSNGTYVNDERIPPQAPVAIEPGAEIRAGAYRLILRQQSAAPPRAVKAPPQMAGRGATEGAPPAPPPPHSAAEEGAGFPPGLSYYSQKLIDFLPGIYQTDFMRRFLALFESVWLPIERNVDAFDLFLSPGTAPLAFLPWLESWFDIAADPSWTEAQRRELLREAPRIFARRGTRWALGRVLEIYTGVAPVIDDMDPGLDPFNFKVTIPAVRGKAGRKREMIERLIDAHKPAHTFYTLEMRG